MAASPAESVAPEVAWRDEGEGAFLRDVLAGLSLPQKALPARWFYDEAGSRLFEAITGLPEYYPTRAETEILGRHGAGFAAAIDPGRAVIEFGSGSSTKTPHVLRAIAPAAYVPIDISGDFLRQAAASLAQRFPGLPVIPLEADFTGPVALPEEIASLPKLGFFPGSTIGNFSPPAAVDLLRSMRTSLAAGHRRPAQLLIGMDLIKDRDVLVAAYDDAAGVTAAFNLNLVDRINRELGGDIARDGLRHRAVWNDPLARIEMHLQAVRDLAFGIAGRRFAMAAGETIHTENSHKYDRRSAAMLLLAGGWTPRREWRDGAERFALILAEASAQGEAP